MKKLILIAIILITGNISLSANLNNRSIFVENKGQWKSNILFSAQQNGINTNITKEGIYFDFFKSENGKVVGDVIKMNFNNYENLTISKKLKNEFTLNYFKGNNPNAWIKNVNTFEKIIYENLYSGINLELIISENSPRYDFVLEPFANPDQIEITFEGVQSISNENEILVLNAVNSIIENKNLFAYQIINGAREQIDCQFELNNNKIKFRLGEYDQSKKLIIDPMVYSSFYGGAGEEKANVVKFIDEENIVIAGTSNSSDLKTTTGAYEEEYGDRSDGFITKLRIENSEYIPVFTTYLGSLEYDEIVDLDIDEDYFLVIGNTRSSDFPLVKPFKSQFGGKFDIFISSIGLEGDTLLQSSFYGGSGDDKVIEVNRVNNSSYLLGGTTTSDNIQVLGGPPNGNYKGDIDILIFSINSNRSSVSLSTYIGGLRDDVLQDMYLDNSTNEILLTGYTFSSTGGDTDFPNYPKKRFGQGGPYDETLNGNKDAFVIQLLQGAQDFKASTYIGGDGDDIGKGVWLSDNDEIYVVGETYSNKKNIGFPVTIGNNEVKGNSEVFLAKFNKITTVFPNIKTQSLGFSRLYSSIGNDSVNRFVENPNGGGFGLLFATRGDFPELKSSEIKQKNNIIYSVLSSSNGTVNSSSLYGGSDDEFPTDITFDSYGNYLITGYTSSSDFETTVNAADKTISGSSDIVIIRDNSYEVELLNPRPNQLLCVGAVASIRWSGEELDTDDGYDIAYMLNNDPNTFKTIVSDLKSEVFNWTIPQDLSGEDSVTIRVSHTSGAFDQNDQLFAVNESAKISQFELITSDTICIGDSIVLNATSLGTGIEYIWYKDNQEIERTSENSLTINDVGIEDRGVYKVSVQNECPPQQFSENDKYIHVSENTDAGDLPTTITKKKGETLELTTDVKGVNLNYEWYKDGNVVPSQNSATLTLSNISLLDAGFYKCVINGKCGIDSTNISEVIIDDVIGNVEHNLIEIATINEINKGILNIKMNKTSTFDINLYNIEGILVTNFKNRLNSLVLDLNNYNSGIYWLVVKTNNQFYKYRVSHIK